MLLLYLLMLMTRFLLIRHGATHTVGKQLAGRMPGISLNDDGRKEATLLAERLATVQLHAVYSSPLDRCVETAAPILANRDLQLKIDEHFNELDFGSWTGKSIAELQSDNTFKLFNEFRSNTRIPGGEMMGDAQLRFVRGLTALQSQQDHATIAVVSHSDLIKSAICYYAGIHIHFMLRLQIDPCSVSIIDLYPETALIQTINNTGSLQF